MQYVDDALAGLLDFGGNLFCLCQTSPLHSLTDLECVCKIVFPVSTKPFQEIVGISQRIVCTLTSLFSALLFQVKWIFGPRPRVDARALTMSWTKAVRVVCHKEAAIAEQRVRIDVDSAVWNSFVITVSRTTSCYVLCSISSGTRLTYANTVTNRRESKRATLRGKAKNFGSQFSAAMINWENDEERLFIPWHRERERLKGLQVVSCTILHTRREMANNAWKLQHQQWHLQPTKQGIRISLSDR